MATVTVTHLAADKFRLETRDHVVLVDQPSDDGTELGPTPVELLVMALAGCAAHYAVNHLRAAGLPAAGLTVHGRWSMRTGPVRVGRVELTVVLPDPIEPDQERNLLSAIEHCTVHNTLRHPPHVEVQVAEPSMVAVGIDL
ncbi:OsmC family protein [Amycolatopsis sp. NPDC059027]|uniref:OsmC family protein n=1 Tax=unclassified Amycolatopsis TaxID=2618356 RepID=UPI0036733393